MFRHFLAITVGATLLMGTLSCSDDEKDNPVTTNPNPVVAITAPANNAHVGDVVSMEAAATDDKGVAYVEFYFDGSVAGTDYAPPYAMNKNTSQFAHGTDHSIFAVAYDTDDHKTGSVPIFVTIDTVLSNPAPVVLNLPTNITTSSVTLTWSRNHDVDFQQYRIRCDSIQGGSSMPVRKTITNSADTTWTLTGLDDTTKYWFEVDVVDVNARTGAGNEVDGTTRNAPPTTPVVISILRKSDRLTFKWVANLNHDFSRYEIVKSTDSTWSLADQVLTSISDALTVTYDYMTADPTEYVYFVVAVDEGGLRTASAPAGETSVISRFALQYDGTKYCTVPYFSALDLGDTYTLEAWIKQSQTATFMRVIDKSPDGPPYLQYSLISDVTLGADFCGDGSPVRRHGTAGVPLNEWHHAALTYDHGLIIYYIDGVAVDTTGGAITTSCSFATTLNIGRRKMFNEFYFRGIIDEVRVWNVARTPGQMAASYNVHLVGNETGLVCYYDFDEGTGNTINSPVGGNGYLGETSGADSADPVWIASDAPIGY